MKSCNVSPFLSWGPVQVLESRCSKKLKEIRCSLRKQKTVQFDIGHEIS